MDTEFINVYLQKQKSLIDDLLGKNLLLEVKLTIMERQIAELTSKVEQAATTAASDTKKVKASPNT